MKFEWNKRYNTYAAYAVGVLIAAAIFIFVLLRWDEFDSVLSRIIGVCKPLIYAVGIAYLLWPLMTFFEKKAFAGIEKHKPRKKIVRILSLVCTYIIFLLVLTLFFGTVIPQISSSFMMLMDRMSQYISTAQTWIDDFIGQNAFIDAEFVNGLVDRLNDLINQLITWIYDNFRRALSGVTSYAANFATEIWNIVLGIIFAVYFLLFKENLLAQVKKLFMSVLSEPAYQKAAHYAALTDRTFGGFINGKLLDSLIIGILCFILMSIFRMPYAPLISLIIGITNVIPFFGPFIGAIPSTFFVFIADPGMTLWFVLLVFLLQQLDGNVIGPKILGDFIGLSPLWVIVSITVMGGLLGIFGMFLGVPTFAVIYAFIKEITEKNLDKKGLPTDTDAYYADTDYLVITHAPPKHPANSSPLKKFFVHKKHPITSEELPPQSEEPTDKTSD